MLCSGNARKIGMLILIFAILMTMPIYSAPVKYEMTYKGLIIQGFDTTCPIIYDNDWVGYPRQKLPLGKGQPRIGKSQGQYCYPRHVELAEGISL
jgi:hypothetical protein